MRNAEGRPTYGPFECKEDVGRGGKGIVLATDIPIGGAKEGEWVNVGKEVGSEKVVAVWFKVAVVLLGHWFETIRRAMGIC